MPSILRPSFVSITHPPFAVPPGFLGPQLPSNHTIAANRLAISSVASTPQIKSSTVIGSETLNISHHRFFSLRLHPLGAGQGNPHPSNVSRLHPPDGDFAASISLGDGILLMNRCSINRCREQAEDGQTETPMPLSSRQTPPTPPRKRGLAREPLPATSPPAGRPERIAPNRSLHAFGLVVLRTVPEGFLRPPIDYHADHPLPGLFGCPVPSFFSE